MNKLCKSDFFMSIGTTLITTSIILWEDFGMMFTPSVLTVTAAVFFVLAGKYYIREEKDELRF